jgi:hypothetical protein
MMGVGHESLCALPHIAIGKATLLELQTLLIVPIEQL